jgi:hypothetical protein
VGGGLDAGDVQFRKRLGVMQNGLQLRLKGRHLVIAQFETGEIGDVADIDVAVRHGWNVGKRRLFSKCQVCQNFITGKFTLNSLSMSKYGRSPAHGHGESEQRPFLVPGFIENLPWMWVWDSAPLSFLGKPKL